LRRGGPSAHIRDRADKRLHDRSVALVEEMLQLQKDRAEAERNLDDKRHALQRRIPQVDQKIDAPIWPRAAFLAQLHRTRNVDDWLTHIIQERIELEEAAFMGVKQDLAAKTG
jgi:hypothetical protein